MSKVILQISYDIDPARREAFLSLIGEMKKHFVEERKKQYLVYEVKGRANSFVEHFVCNSLEEFEALEDDFDDSTEALINKLEGMIKGGKAKYTTLQETE
jgi:hypothetical protein